MSELNESIEFGEFQMAPGQAQEAQGAQAQTEEQTCWGCREGVLNQLGHMDYGGCLYEPIETRSRADTQESKDST